MRFWTTTGHSNNDQLGRARTCLRWETRSTKIALPMSVAYKDVAFEKLKDDSAEAQP